MIDKTKYAEYTEWRLNGKLHREDGPAIEYHNGDKFWYKDGLPHRDDGPAIEFANGSKAWYFNGERHREDGPAKEYIDGTKEWYLNGEYHRDDGPAVEWPDSFNAWHLNGYWIYEIKLHLTKKFTNCIGQFLHNKDKDYLILCFERDNYYFYTVLWKKGIKMYGKRYNCSLEELKSVLR